MLSNAMPSVWGCYLSFLRVSKGGFLNSTVLSHVRALPVHAWGSVKRKTHAEGSDTPGCFREGHRNNEGLQRIHICSPSSTLL